MVGIGLVFALLVSAMAAGSASAAKSPYSVNTWGQYKYCPYENPETDFCFTGITSGGSKGGFFKLGNVTVKLNKPITLQGGGHNTGEGTEQRVLAAVNGGATLEAPELKAQGGLSVISKLNQEEAAWPEALTQSFKEAKKNKEANVNVQIELAGGNLLYEEPDGISVLSLIGESGVAFKLPLKVRLISPWLEKLGGGPCTIGNDAYPVMQNLTSEGAGAAGVLMHNEEFTNIALQGSKLVDTGWPVEEGAKASGCGGVYESFVDDALNKALNIHPGKLGITVLEGTLFTGEPKIVKEKAEKGEL